MLRGPMVLLERLRQRSTINGLGAVLFASGLVLLFGDLYKNASHTSWSLLPIVALCVLAAAVVCWIAAARWEEQPNSAFDDPRWWPGLESPETTVRRPKEVRPVPRPKEFRQPDSRANAMAKKTWKTTGWNRPLAYQ